MRKDPTEFRKRFQSWKQGIPAYEDGKPIDYTKAAQESRDREYNTAISYFKGTPNIQNMARGAYHLAKSTPLFGDTPASVNPNMIYGDAPAVGYRNPAKLAETTRRIKQAVKPFVNGVSHTKLSAQALQQEIRYGDTYYPEQLTIAERNAMAKLRQSKLAKEKGKYVMVDNAPKVGQKNYILMESGRPQAEMVASIEDGSIIPEMVYKTNKAAHNTTTDLYSGVLKYQKQAGNTGGMVSGESYKSTPATLKQVKKFKKEKISDNGTWDNEGLVGYGQEPTVVKTMEGADKLNKKGKAFILYNQPIYRLLQPVKDIPIKDRYMFDPRHIGPNGEYNIDMSNPSRFAQNQDDSNQRHYFRGGKNLNMGPRRDLSISEVKEIAEKSRREQPLDGADPLLKWLIPQRAVGKAISIGREIFNNHLHREAQREYREAREAGHGRETARFIATPDNLPYDLLNWESKLFDWGFKNGKDLPRFEDGDDLKVTIDRGTRYSPIGGDFIWRMNPINEAKYRLYKNMSPYSYAGFYERAKSAIFDDVAEENQKDDIIVNDPRDDQFATYLGIPKEMRRLNVRKLQPALYHPTQNEDTSIPTYRLPLTKNEIRRFIESQYPFPYGTTIIDPDTGSSKNLGVLPFNKNIQVSGIWDVASKALTDAFGSYTEGHGLDKNRGEYFSYYDRYDLNPTSGDNAVNDDILNKLPEWYLKKLKQTGDVGINSGITHPFALYDRIYLNDYYGVNDQDVAPDIGDYYGGYFPEIIVYPKHKYKSGKDIYIKPSHRGRLTALKKRTGKSEAELYRTGSAATRKMITFARNSRKWKH